MTISVDLLESIQSHMKADNLTMAQWLTIALNLKCTMDHYRAEGFSKLVLLSADGSEGLELSWGHE